MYSISIGYNNIRKNREKMFWTLYTYTPWNSQSQNKLAQVRLMSSKDSFNSKYPIISQKFIKDLYTNISKYKHYSHIKSIKRIVDPSNKDYSIQNWSLLWAMDSKDRIYQLLFQKTKVKNIINNIIVALAPPQLVELMKSYQRDALVKTLSLLNTPKQIKFLKLLFAHGKSLAETKQSFNIDKTDLQKIKMANYLKRTPNIEGQWLPHFAPKCPICGNVMKELEGYRFMYRQWVCPTCGYEKYQK